MSKNRIFFNLSNYDGCKNCNAYSFVCKYCQSREFYRHIDDKIKMKENLKIVRERNLIDFIFCLCMSLKFKF